jgi:hypothetical protein
MTFAIDVQMLVCPITHALFREPIVLPDGNTYEKDAVVKLIDAYENNLDGRRRFWRQIECPLDPSVKFRDLSDTAPNKMVRTMVKDFTKRNPRHDLVKDLKKIEKELDHVKSQEIMANVRSMLREAADLGNADAKELMKRA